MLGRQPALELLEVIGSESHGDSVAGDRLDQTGRDGGVVVEQQTLANEHPRDPSRRRVDLDRLDVADAVALAIVDRRGGSDGRSVIRHGPERMGVIEVEVGELVGSQGQTDIFVGACDLVEGHHDLATIQHTLLHDDRHPLLGVRMQDETIDCSHALAVAVEHVSSEGDEHGLSFLEELQRSGQRESNRGATPDAREFEDLAPGIFATPTGRGALEAFRLPVVSSPTVVQERSPTP